MSTPVPTPTMSCCPIPMSWLIVNVFVSASSAMKGRSTITGVLIIASMVRSLVRFVFWLGKRRITLEGSVPLTANASTRAKRIPASTLLNSKK